MSKELQTTNTTEMLNTLRNTVAPGLTDPEFYLFAEMCKATGLNPATKEIWAIKAGGRLQLMTGINGFLKIANSHPAFDGMEVNHEWDGKTLVSCTVKVHRKDRKYPAIATAYMAEYGKPTPIWRQMPSVMLAKCAKSLAIREAFIQELGGLYTAEEMPSEYGANKVDTNTGEIISPKAYKAAITEAAKTAKAESEADNIPEVWTEPEVQPVANVEPAKSRKATPTYYDLSKIEEEYRTAAERYLTECEAKHVTGLVWRSPIKLKKLTQCISGDYSDVTEA